MVKVKSIVIDKTGSPEVLKYVDTEVGDPNRDEVLVEHTAIGLNRYDVEHRTGMRKVKSFPAVLGVEAVGIVRQIGDGVEALNVGDRVGYCTARGGAYSEARIINQKYLFKISDDISDDTAAAVMLKAMTAHYLTHRIYDVRPGTFALVHGVSGGVGHMLCQWARYKGCKVIGVIGSGVHADIAKEVGCSYIVQRNDKDVAQDIMNITSGRGVNVVYDPVGEEASNLSFSVLGTFGLYVSYGQISGPVPKLSMSVLSSKSWFVTSPLIYHYKRSRLELSLTAMEIFKMLKKGHLTVNVNKVYKFKEMVKAHKDLESRKLVGLSIIKF